MIKQITLVTLRFPWLLQCVLLLEVEIVMAGASRFRSLVMSQCLGGTDVGTNYPNPQCYCYVRVAEIIKDVMKVP